MLDDREAQRLLADAENVGHPDRGEPEDGTREHRFQAVRDRHTAREPSRVEDGPHVEDGNEGAADPDEDEPQELGGGDHVHRFHPKMTFATTWPTAAATVIGANARKE